MIRWNPKWLVLLGSLIGVAVVVVLLLTPDAQTHGQALDALNQRLNEIGVQPVSATLERRAPLELAIRFHEKSARVSPEELWRFFLVIREVKLLYLSGFPVSSYTTAIEGPDGEITMLGTTYLSPGDRSQQLRPADPPALDDHQTEKVVEEFVRTDLDRLRLPKDLHL